MSFVRKWILFVVADERHQWRNQMGVIKAVFVFWALGHCQLSFIVSGNIPLVLERVQKHLCWHSLSSSLQRTARAPLHNAMGNVSDERGIFFPQSFLYHRSSNGHYILWLCEICWNQSYVIYFAEGPANPGQPHSCLDHGWGLGNWKPDPEGIPNTD